MKFICDNCGEVFSSRSIKLTESKVYCEKCLDKIHNLEKYSKSFHDVSVTSIGLSPELRGKSYKKWLLIGLVFVLILASLIVFLKFINKF
jgi:hypothetical protein